MPTLPAAPPTLFLPEKEFTSFQLSERKVTASAAIEVAIPGSFHPPAAELALKSPCTYKGFSTASVRPQETPEGQAPTAVRRLPSTTLMARRKKSGGFSRAALALLAYTMGQMAAVE